MFNLGFMIEEGARIPRSILNKVPIPTKYQRNNVTMLEYIYTRFDYFYEIFSDAKSFLWHYIDISVRTKK